MNAPRETLAGLAKRLIEVTPEPDFHFYTAIPQNRWIRVRKNESGVAVTIEYWNGYGFSYRGRNEYTFDRSGTMISASTHGGSIISVGGEPRLGGFDADVTDRLTDEHLQELVEALDVVLNQIWSQDNR